MSRRSSIPSAIVSAPVIGNGHANFPTPPERQEGTPINRPGNKSRSISLSKVPALNDTQGAELDPDELFTKHTISEVKFIQQRLRADADAKQEELRLMVGERYRDLLQASTSIIAIARSSQRVKEALEETKEAILSQEEPPFPQKPSLGGDDTHLHTLQLLSAHMKLLLDAPEHLWRLIERKKYYSAAWLFLLARVVHRALVQDGDDQEEETWSRQGVDVLEQFPLIQRQWDAVSQFRSQIIHKATVSLREHNAAVEDTCATLLTLHLLDSRPLAETLSVLLGQRTKTLHTMVSWNYQADISNSSNKRPNGAPPEPKANTLTSDFRKKPVNKVREATHAALGVISQTCKTARSIFHDNNSQASLIRRVLEYIQSDSPTHPSESLPTDLRLTTQTLLTTLPSSAHFLLLPQNLRSYKPYVDLNSPSSSIQRSQFTQKMGEWFHHSSIILHAAVERWFCNLESIKEVWSVRSSTRAWILSSPLEQEEITQLISALDNQCQQRAIEIWRLKLDVALESFGESLDSATSGSNEGSEDQRTEASLAGFLFQAPPLPLLSQTSAGPADASFQKYKASLRRQIVGRTSLLDGLLFILEKCAKTIQQDLSHVKSGGDDAQVLVDRLANAYRPEADTLCANVVQRLETTSQRLNDTSHMSGLILLGRVAEELSSPSPFISEIGCTPSTLTDFRAQTSALHGGIIDRWQELTVSRVVKDHRLGLRPRNPNTTKSVPPSGPSAGLVRSLLSLSNLIEQLGISRNQFKHTNLVQGSLRQFISGFTGDGWERGDIQSLCDLAFLWKLAELQGVEWVEICRLLGDRIETNLRPGEDSSDLKRIASESLTRTQTLFATFLPRPSLPPRTLSPAPADKFASLLPFGVPILEQQFQSAIDLAKPSSRFGLLLVGGA